ncbi:hypothetical protein RJ639_044667 [Escallonia herrerae]|uniref:Reverse transcriptase Ty1/copia-type domain-containing protein n=1 Tax=Escallonia herrerae TaxID=1293975 RepID=A0AA88WFS9_9ASTE|nr:hypothetical protein RJ639_044667 [Escallonia herrerae]
MQASSIYYCWVGPIGTDQSIVATPSTDPIVPYMISTPENFILAALIYVDDVIITGTNSAHISILKRYLDAKFHIKDLCKLKYFLGIEVSRSPAGFALSQCKYALDILAESGLTRCKPAPLPME